MSTANSPFGPRLRRYHENPLFKSSSSDQSPGMDSDEDVPFKENAATVDFSGLKVIAGVSTTKTKSSSKRILGESNWCVVDEEPPKSIRALSFSAERTSDGSSGETLSSLTMSPPSPTSRFTLSPEAAASPDGSGSSSGSSEVEGSGHNYDPRVNLRTPRPKFLRYRPDWRLEFLSSLELKEGESLEDAIGCLRSREEESSGLDGKEEADDLSTKTSPLRDVEDEDGNSKVTSGFCVTESAEKSLGDQLQDDAADERLSNGTEDVKSLVKQEQSTLSTTLKAAAVMLLLGSLAAILTLMLAAETSSGIENGNPLSTLWQKTENLELESKVVTGDFDYFDDWEWSPDYDISETFHNRSGGPINLFSTDSLELDALLMAIAYGSDEDVEQRYLAVMEHDQDTEFYDVRSILAGEFPDVRRADKELSAVTEEESTDAPAALREQTEAYSSSSSEDDLASVSEALPSQKLEETAAENNVDDLRMYFPRLLSSGEIIPRSTTPASYLSLAVAVVLFSAHCLLSLTRKRSHSSHRTSRTKKTLLRRSATSPAMPKPTSPVAELQQPEASAKLIDDLIGPAVEPEENSTYGSFTAFRRLVVNEGSSKELVTLTPVRRSSRIRDQHSSILKSSRSPPARRILLSPA